MGTCWKACIHSQHPFLPPFHFCPFNLFALISCIIPLYSVISSYTVKLNSNACFTEKSLESQGQPCYVQNNPATHKTFPQDPAGIRCFGIVERIDDPFSLTVGHLSCKALAHSFQFSQALARENILDTHLVIVVILHSFLFRSQNSVLWKLWAWSCSSIFPKTSSSKFACRCVSFFLQ